MRHYKAEGRSNRIGILFLIFGILFLLGNLHILPAELSNLALNWKGIILVIGIVLYSSKHNKLPGTVMISIALYLIVAEYAWQEYGVNIGLSRIFWPGMMMAAGYILLKNRKIETKRRNSGDSFEYLSDSNIMGGGEVKVQSQNFKGGHTTAIFGGASYDMSRSKLAEGRHTLDVFAMFGGFTFILPSDWDVQLEITAIFGGVDDKRKHIKPSTSDTAKQLRIKGFVMFGGGEIKNY